MKRMICIILLLLLLINTAGCGVPGRENKNAPVFYYTRAEYKYGTPDGVISGEIREMSGHLQDRRYLLSMYLLGPETEGLTLPFPQGTRLVELESDENKLTVTLIASSMPEIQFTLACTCLARTCMEAFGIDTVTLQCGEQSRTMTRDSMILSDNTNITEE